MFNDAEFEQLKKSILALGPVLPGTLRKVFLRCGKKNCRCQSNDKKQWHGPYSFWDRKEGNKLSSRSIPPDQVKVFEDLINKRRELERVVQQMLKHGVTMAEQLRSAKKLAAPLDGGKSKKGRARPVKGKLALILGAILMASAVGKAQAADIQAQLDSNNGSSGFTIINSSGVGVDRTDSNGNVGIGTTTALTLLYVSPQGFVPTYVGPQDAFIQNNLEVDGTAYLNDVYINGLEVNGGTFHGGSSIDQLTVLGDTYLAASSGNVGIGTSSSASELTVNGGVSVGTALNYRTTLAPVNGLMVQGNVGIGLLAPGQALDVNGTVRTVGLTMSGQTPVSGYVLTASDSAGDATWSSAGGVSGWTVSGTNVYETGSGNVGIGTTTVTQGALVVTNGNVGIGTWVPAAPFAVGANAFTVSSLGAINTSGGYTQSGSGLNTLTGTTTFNAAATSALFVNNVGIGSAAPGQALDVTGTVRTTFITMSGQTPISGYVLTASDSAGDTTWTSAGTVSGWTVSGNNVYETLSGNVGIGTTTVTQGALVVTNGNVGIGTWVPAAPFAVGANAFTVSSLGAINTSGGYTQSGSGLNTLTGTTTFNAAATSALFVNNVGIGSAAPGQALDVTGTVRTTGFTMSGQTPVSGYVLTASDSAGDTTWTSAGTVSGWTVSGNNVYETLSGNVGIGTTAITQGALVVTNGNVGIGTWAPTAPLAVGANAFTVSSLGAVNTAGGYTQVGTGVNSFSGNVGLGSTTPGQALDVTGTVRTMFLAMSGQTPVSGYVLTASDSAGDATWASAAAVSGWTVSGNNVYETGSGNVGIGTTTITQGALVVTNGNVGIGTWVPAAPFAVGANAFTVSSLGAINTSGGYTQSGNGLNTLSGTTAFSALGTSALFASNVGIGSAAPGQALDVTGTVRTMFLAMSGQTPVSGYVLTASDSAGDTTWTAAGSVSGWTVSGTNVYETLSGNVGIGTTAITQGALVVTNGNVGIGTWVPAAPFAVGANAFTVSSLGAINTSGGYTQSGSGLNTLTGTTTFNAAATSALFVNNVGIGSAAPGQALDVTGTVRTVGFTVSGQTPISGYVLTASDSAGDTTWTSAGTVSGWTVSGNNVYETLSGNVGIGTTAITQGALVVTNGNVGIGTWAPTAPLTVGANAFTVSSLGVINTSGGYTQSGSGLNTLTGTTTFNAPSTSALFVNNVGIGSAAPGQALDVTGTVRTTFITMSGQTPVSGYVLTASDSAGDTTWTSAGTVSGWTVSGNNVYETLSGNVGIGTTAITQGALVVTNGNVGIGTWAPAAVFQVGPFSSSSSGFEVGSSGNVGIGTILTSSSSLTVMNGNVGIGTWVPNALVSLGNTINTIKLAVWDGGPAALYGMGVNAGELTFGANIPANGTPQMVMTPAGNVGIGTTTPASNLAVVGGASLGTYVNTTAPVGGLIASGNVGLGSTAPGQALDVTGTVRTTGFTMSGQTPVSGYVLTASDSAGDTTWTSAGTVSGWTVSGNNVYETLSGNVGIGTTAITQGALVVTNGNVGIGTWVPTAPLTVGANAFTVSSLGVINTSGGYTQVGTGVNSFSGNVGLGSTTPGQALDVTGTVRTVGFAMSGQTPTSGYVLTASDSAGDATWASASAVSGWTVSGNNVYETGSGNVGIGTTTITQGALVVTNGNVGIGTWAPAGILQVGTNTLFVNASSGNVGIGTAVPGQALDVNGSIRTTTTGGIIFGTDNKAFIQPSAVTTPDLKFLTNNAEIMRITNGGNVGIGTTLPQGKLAVGGGNLIVNGGGNVGIGSSIPGQALDVIGTVRTTFLTMSGQTPTSGYVLTASDSAGDATWASASAVSGWTVSGNNVYETGSGNVGIGTTAITQGALVVTNGNVGIGTWVPAAPLAVGANAFTVSSLGAINTSGGYTQVGTGINSFSGNVGLGSTAPGQKLDVNGTVRTTAFTMSGQTPISGYVMTASDSAGDTTWTSAGTVSGWTVSGNNVYETLSGNVGIGTTAITQGALVVTNGNVGIGTWVPAGIFQVGTNTLFVNAASGNVGIGTAVPGQALDVVGTLRDLGLIVNGNVGIGTSSLQTALAVANGNVGIGTWTSSSTLSIKGSIAVPTVSPIANYSASANDQVILVNASATNVTVTLPPASSVPGREYIIKKTDSSPNVVIIQANAAENIDGQNTVSITIQYQSYAIVCDGSEWNII